MAWRPVKRIAGRISSLSFLYTMRQRIIVLGNCVADRLQYMLEAHPLFGKAYVLTPAPMIHTQRTMEQTDALAASAVECDIILTQPLFHYGRCNTASLRDVLKPGQRLYVFSAPNFEAYFPDVLHLEGKGAYASATPLEWDSRIIFSCFVAGVPILEVEDVYLNHPLFHESAVRLALERSVGVYAKREQNVDIGTEDFVLRNFAKYKLFHTWNHPSEPLLAVLLTRLLRVLELPRDAEHLCIVRDGFGFNQWPVITRHHSLFQFSEQACFMVAGQRFAIGDIAMAYYNFYEAHPEIVERNRCIVPH